MPLFAITRTGLTAITLSVLSLWTCLLMERATLHQATIDASITVRNLERLRRGMGPSQEREQEPGTAPRYRTQRPSAG